MTSWRQKTSDQRLNNVYVNEKIYNVEQRQINVIYFEVDLNNFVIFNVDFHSVGQDWNKVVNMTICKKSKK